MTVSSANCRVNNAQVPDEELFQGVFFTPAPQAISYHCATLRRSRVSHAPTMKVNDFGNVGRALAIGYPRRAFHNADLVHSLAAHK